MKPDIMKLGMSYFGNRYVECAQQHLRKMKEMGASYVVFTFSENDFFYYKHTMQELFDIAHQMGLEVWADPWAIGGVFGGEAFSKFLLDNLDVWQVRNDGEKVPHACLNSAKFKEFLKKLVDSIASSKADYIFWDEPHWYIPKWDGSKDESLWACRCERCRNLFEKEYGYAMPEVANDDVVGFKENSALSFFKEMTKYAKEKGLKNAVCFLPIEDDKTISIPYEKVASLDTIDVIGSDPYWYIFGKNVDDFVKPVTERMVKIGEKYSKEVQMWFQGYKVPRSREEEMKRAVEAMYSLGVRNVAVWSYNGAGHMSSLRSDNPKKVNDILEEIFKDFSKR